MKKITVFIAILFATIVSAQNSKVNKTLCEENITIKQDEGETQYFATYNDDVSFVRVTKENGESVHYVSIRYIDSGKPQVKKKGAVIYFGDKIKIERPEVEVKIRVNKKAEYEYSVFFKVTDIEALLLSMNKITATKIYTFKNEPKDAEKIRQVFKCIHDYKGV